MRRNGFVRRRLFIALIAAVALVFAPVERTAGGSREPVRARSGMVVSSHYLASQVGVEILKRGGNAVDAAIATGFALAVVHPSAGNIGGGGFMLVRKANGEVRAFDFREKAPVAAHARMFLDESGQYTRPTNHEGWLSIGVPGTVAGFSLAHEKLGKLPMRDLIAPAVELAEKGFPLSWSLADEFKYYASQFKKYPGSVRIFLKENGELYQPGEIWKQPDLARTLRRIQELGRDGFYRGETAREVATAMKENGGLITEADLAAYEAKERMPLRGTYRGYEIIGMPPPSSGGVGVLEMLNILQGYDLFKAGFGSAQHLHLLAEAMRRAFADRARYLGDTDFNPDMPVARLISKEYARELGRTIQPERASVSDPARFNDMAESQETTHY